MIKIEPGLQVGKITVVERLGTFSNGDIKWLCLCFCGNHFPVRASVLRAKRPQKSCGCTRESIETLTGKPSEKTRAYKSYKAMLSRCYNPRDKSYSEYAGRGITVCPSWQESFNNFFRDMGERPTGFSLDRIDNNGNYEPSNCRWATKTEQQRNRRVVINITYNVETKSKAEWAELLNINYHTLSNRLKRGWPVSKALSIPSHLHIERRLLSLA